jgi:hypothetical protein
MGVLRAKVAGLWVDITGPQGLPGPQGPPGPSAVVTAWTRPTLLNSWVDYDAAQPVQYRKVGDEVQIRGFMNGGAATTAAFFLPAGFRPPTGRTENFIVWITGGGGGSGVGVSVVGSTGEVRPLASFGGVGTLTPIRFSTVA